MKTQRTRPHTKPPRRFGSIWLSTAWWLLGAAIFALCGYQAHHSLRPAPSAVGVATISSERTDRSTQFCTKPIEAIQEGDEVLACDPETGRLAWKRATAAFQRQTNHLQIIEVATAGETQELRTTDEHPFWVPDRGWCEARWLQVGDRLLLADGALGTVASHRRQEHPDPVPVFNFTVEDYHTYFVCQAAGLPPILVHNSNNCAKALADAANEAAEALTKKADDAAEAAAKSAPAARTARLTTRAEEVHSVLHPIARRQRTTAVLETSGGDIIGGGGIDLTPAQRAALRPGEIAARLPGEHAEITALQEAARRGLRPRAISTTRDFCPDCRRALEEAGARITGPRTAVWD
jgi:hypothetical protein